MARKRMISPEIWESSSFAELSDFAKIVFIGLISNADDAGKGEANAALLKSKLFPRDEKKRAADVKSALSEIARSTSTLFYSIEGHDYYALTTWKRWQKLDRPTPSKIPDPPQEQSVGERGSYMQNQKLDEYSTNTRRILDEGSPLIEKNRKEIEKNRKEVKEDINTTHALEVEIVSASAAMSIEPKNKEEATALWKTTLDKLIIDVNSLGFDVWIEPLVALGYIDNTLVLQAATQSACDEVTLRYLPILRKYVNGE